MPVDFVAFALASAAIALVPGPDILYVVSRGMAQGRQAALVSAVALNTGAAIHASLAALGLSAIINQSEALFTAIKYVGATYLVYLAISMLLDRKSRVAVGFMERSRLLRIFVQGVATDLLNPKVYLFFLAFLPQFVDPQAGNTGTQILALGLVFVLINLPIDLTIAWLSGSLGNVLLRRPRVATGLRWCSAGVLLGLAGRVARSAVS